MPIEITMPRLSDTMESGTIIKWNIKEGDTVSAGDVIADVETDKATMEMQVYDDGTITRIAVPEGKKASVGTVIAELTAKGEDAKAAPKKPEGRPPDSAKPKAKDTADSQPPADAEGQEEAVPVVPKKAAVAPHAKPAAEVAEPDGADVADSGDSVGDVADEGRNGRMRISPVARRLADEHDLDLGAIHGSGPGGRIIKRDVLEAMNAAKETKAAVPPSAQRAKPRAAETTEAPEGRSEIITRTTPAFAGVSAPAGAGLESRIISLSGMRQTIAKRLVESKTTIPHYQVTVTFSMDPLLSLREMLNQQLEPQGVKLSVNDFLVRACALAIHEHPEFNASWVAAGGKGSDDGAEPSIEIHAEVNIGMAISLPPETGGGLVVATIRNADLKGLRHIAVESRALADKARTRGLTIQEMSGSTFTISNLGMFGVDNFTAIINPPNSAILAVGAAVKKPVVRDDQLTIGQEMSATLSCDHRVIDGAMAARYLQTLRQLIENPATVMV